MKRKYERFFLGALVFCLLTVLVGSSVFIHTDDVGSASQVGASFNILQGDASTSFSDVGDPCTSGYCHLGHCAKLILPTFVFFSFEHKVFEPKESELRGALERVLEGPFQPPRAV
ncbi:hypothetical protein B9G69_004770 [Bdellovibrio sp. SKB1291214]|uniref:hypothetical protein n=1 Tax=Bdellovibrio sp. SKB1291214 TaxID=1732569 RepID=UPI000B515165|nr:hypothetical protein [Bdellovibrio sp. SKB1291214]UYL09886.1 hypothetical protein B9G69_004770 [Bdellovibrio sp. SKB1291214]